MGDEAPEHGDRRRTPGRVRLAARRRRNDRGSVPSHRMVRRAQDVGGARGRLGGCDHAPISATHTATAGRSRRAANAGGASLAAFVSGVVRCWQSAQSALWARAQSLPVWASMCECARALIASRSTLASAMETKVGSMSCSSTVICHSTRTRPVDRCMRERYPVGPARATGLLLGVSVVRSLVLTRMRNRGVARACDGRSPRGPRASGSR